MENSIINIRDRINNLSWTVYWGYSMLNEKVSIPPMPRPIQILRIKKLAI